jgi:hypothetical protein
MVISASCLFFLAHQRQIATISSLSAPPLAVDRKMLRYLSMARNIAGTFSGCLPAPKTSEKRIVEAR